MPVCFKRHLFPILTESQPPTIESLPWMKLGKAKHVLLYVPRTRHACALLLFAIAISVLAPQETLMAAWHTVSHERSTALL